MRYLIVFLLLFGGLAACQDPKPKTNAEGPPIQSNQPVVFEKAKQVPLSPETVDQFINWASGSSEVEKEAVRQEIQKASKNDEVSEALFSKFETTYISDISYSLVVLSILGELKNPLNLPRFAKIVAMPIPVRKETPHGAIDSTDAIEMLSSKAVECMAYLQTNESNKAVLDIVKTHSSMAVRSAAIDGYLFNNGDSDEAKKSLAQVARKEDLPQIYRTRMIRTKDPKQFNAEGEQFYKQFPDEKAAAPDGPTDKPRPDKATENKPVAPPKRKSDN